MTAFGTKDGWVVWAVRLLITTSMAVGAWFAHRVYDVVVTVDSRLATQQAQIQEKITATRESMAERTALLENRTTKLESAVANIEKTAERIERSISRRDGGAGS